MWLSDEAARNLKSLGYGSWVTISDHLVTEALVRYQVRAVRPIHKGKAGILIRVEDDSRQQLVLKLAPADILLGQIEALTALAGCGVPELVACHPNSGSLLLEFISGEPWPLEQVVDLQQAVAFILAVKEHPTSKHRQSCLATLEPWLNVGQQPRPPALEKQLALAKQIIEQESGQPQQHVHGDMGIHNMIYGQNGQMWVVDPGGVYGPAAYDAGFLTAFSGTTAEGAIAVGLQIAQLAELDDEQVLRWAAVRLTASANLAYARGSLDHYQDRLLRAERILLRLGMV